MGKIREILLTQYIGSILIALLVIQAGTAAVNRIGRIGLWLFSRGRSASVLRGASGVPFAWDYLLESIVSIALYLAAAYWLAAWLYPAVPSQSTTDDTSVPVPGEGPQT